MISPRSFIDKDGLFQRVLRGEDLSAGFGSPKAPVSREILLRDFPAQLSLYRDRKALSMYAREQYIENCGYSVVTADLVKEMIPHLNGKIVEVMAGGGWLGAHLREAGVHLAVTDNFTWDDRWKKKHTLILGQDAVDASYDADTVIMSWPYMDDTAFRVMLAMKSGATLLYCGESSHGCTADEEFCDIVCEEESQVLFRDTHLQFEGIHDTWYKWTKP